MSRAVHAVAMAKWICSFPKLPPELESLLSGDPAFFTHFLDNHIGVYNSCFQLTSMGYRDASLNGWNPQFRVQGQCLRDQQGKLRADSYGEFRDATSHQDNADPTPKSRSENHFAFIIHWRSLLYV
ncbi:hypothetical protein ElyMa_000588000 [Elysia marginata]|uniref:Uncharacterized protein n=1 Tax=Elysia marginata TaxID=1093978 RepID=A0AAV4G6P9_9GAST|nr:hypothetical protein ElyMa_000588000 [Elysia marginata]